MENNISDRGLDALKKQFEKPGREFRGKPFWSWNGELEENELKRQVDVLREMGFGGYFMHSRAGLITEYLGEEWFDLCNKVAVYGEEKGMESWLYDEDRWPSGCAGGIVTRDPAYRMKSLVLFESEPDDLSLREGQVAAFEALLGDKDDVLIKYKKLSAGESPSLKAGEGEKLRLLKFAVVYDSPSSNCNGATYIDTMMAAATQRFIEVTHEQYRVHAGEKIWPLIKGIFTDEPHRGRLLDNARRDEKGLLTCGLCWTDDIFDEFRQRYGYDASGMLPEIFYAAPGFETAPAVKHDYVDLANNLFVERFAKPINEWCVKNGITFTGHVLHEDALTNQTVPNGSLMRFYEHMGAPGIDMLSEHADNYWVAKQIQSAARQLGKKWVLSELYGCTGWQFDFKGHKAVGDWQALYGVNLRCPHLSWYTMEGEAKRDYPASILHQATYYKDYNYVEEYFARFGVLMSEGKPVCDVLVLNPIESVWTKIYAGWASWLWPLDGAVNVKEEQYRQLFEIMRSAHVDFDYGEEFLMCEHGSVAVENGQTVLKVGEMSYVTVVVAALDTIRSSTLKLLREFAEKGGRVCLLGDPPYMVDARRSDEFGLLSVTRDGFSKEGVQRSVKPFSAVKVDIEAGPADRIHYQLRDAREKDGIAILALLNTDRTNCNTGVSVRVSGLPGIKGAALWRLEDGRVCTLDRCSVTPDGVEMTLDFLPAGEKTIALYFDEMPADAGADAGPDPAASYFGRKVVFEKELSGEFGYVLGEKNAMVLDFAEGSITAADGSSKHFGACEVLRLDRRIREFAGIEHRGGEMLQPWYAKKYENKVYGKLTLRYEFTVKDVPADGILVCAERPELIDYYLNGRKLEPDGGFWIDSCFKTMPAEGSELHEGTNVITAVTDFRRTTNIESVYLVGDFGVASELVSPGPRTGPNIRGNIYSKNKYMTTLPGSLDFGNITDRGLLSYTGTVSYLITPEMLKDVKPGKGGRAVICCSDFTASLFKVTDKAGRERIMAWEPYEADVTDLLDEGFSLVMVATRKNLFGPLHYLPAIPPGSVGPGHFVTEDATFSEDYALINSRPGRVTVKVYGCENPHPAIGPDP